MNDVEMLQHARIGVAMGNAHEEAKRAADIITRDVSEDGIFVIAADEAAGFIIPCIMTAWLSRLFFYSLPISSFFR